VVSILTFNAGVFGAVDVDVIIFSTWAVTFGSVCYISTYLQYKPYSIKQLPNNNVIVYTRLMVKILTTLRYGTYSRNNVKC
jgi:hypothetical protein